MSDLPKLLRAIASSTQAQENKHDVIFNAAADEIDTLRADIATLTTENAALKRHISELRGAVDALLQSDHSGARAQKPT